MLPNVATLESTRKAYLIFMSGLAGLVFLLSHTSQAASQSMASLLLLVSPGLLLIKQKPLPSTIKVFIALAISIYIYALTTFFLHPNSDVAFVTIRGLTFYLLAPITIATLWNFRFSRKALFFFIFCAALISLYPVLKEIITYQGTKRGSTSVHPIFWGNICLTTGFVAFILSRDPDLPVRAKRVMGWAALACAITASLWSLTRGGWLSVPVILVLLTYFRVISLKHLVVIVISLTTVFLTSDDVRNRVMNTVNSGKLDTSTTHRLEMWSISLHAFEKNPIIGNGLDGFAKQNLEENKQKKVNFYYEHAHNEYFEVLASRGIIGLLLLGSLLISLAFVYVTNRNSIYAKAGIIVLSQYIIFSLTETFFTTKSPVTYFIILNALLLFAIYKESIKNPGPERIPNEP